MSPFRVRPNAHQRRYSLLTPTCDTRTENATRYCHSNGTWANYTNYDQCHHIADYNGGTVHEFKPSIELSTYIYGAGYVMSLTSLLMAIVVFLYFK